MFRFLGLKGNMVNDVLDGLIRSNMAELAEISKELRFSPDHSISKSLGLTELKLQSVIFHFYDCFRVDVNRGLLQPFITLTWP